MILCCTEEFKKEVEGLRKNSSYANIEQVIADGYCDASFEEACTGDLLSVTPGMFYLKKRLQGSGGYRIYILAVVVGEKIYLGFVHPKTGRYGMDNVTPEQKKAISRQILTAIKTNALYLVERDGTQQNRLKFAPYISLPVS